MVMLIQSISYSVLASRRHRNSLCSIVVDGVSVEGVQPVRNVVCSHFANHFRAQRVARPGIGHLQFRRLSCMEGGSLIKPFSVDEFKAAVWTATVLRVQVRMPSILVSSRIFGSR
jgi:hypothetical protein